MARDQREPPSEEDAGRRGPVDAARRSGTAWDWIKAFFEALLDWL